MSTERIAEMCELQAVWFCDGDRPHRFPEFHRFCPGCLERDALYRWLSPYVLRKDAQALCDALTAAQQRIETLEALKIDLTTECASLNGDAERISIQRDEFRTRLEQSEAALGVATKALAEWVDLIHTNEQGCHECSRCWQSTRLLEADIQHEEGCPVAAMRIALSTEAIAAEVERRKRTDAVVEEARAYMAAKEGEEWWASRYISLREAFAAMDAK